MDRSAELALAFINNTDRHVFLTGKAGSGKTTFLRSLKNVTRKTMAIAAPTGIAAVNASGVTLHSLFQLSTTVFLPGETEQRINITAQKRLLLRELELLVIDEVSMLRADVLDAIDIILRGVRKKPDLPFGGVQLLYIGDLHQLSPVATSEELRQLEKHYSSLYFTFAKVFASSCPVCICLEHIYRQTDPVFISVLNNIREGKATKQDVELLNRYFREGSTALDGYVTLVTHNQSADTINMEQLSKMQEEVIQIEAVIDGEFDESMYPTEKVLQLKEGAQIMLLRNDSGNDRKYFNGKMGVIHKIENEKLTISFEDGERTDIQKETWKNIRYEFDQKSSRMLEHENGSFTQFPVRLAWAITIHKSQGLTFDQVVLDINNVFAPGQTYVAFSRVRSLKGLILKEPVHLEIINSNASSPNNESLSAENLTDILDTEKTKFLEKSIKQRLDFESICAFITLAAPNIVNQESHHYISSTINQYQTTTVKFTLEIRNIIETQGKDIYYTICSRVQAACNYFMKEIDDLVVRVLAPACNKSKGSITQKLQYKFVKDLIAMLKIKKRHVELLQQLITRTKVGVLSKEQSVKKEKESGITDTEFATTTLALFNQGTHINEIASQLKISVPTTENYLAAFVLSGELKIQQLVHEETLKNAFTIMEEKPLISVMMLKELFGDELSFGQIKALLNHFKLQSI